MLSDANPKNERKDTNHFPSGPRPSLDTYTTLHNKQKLPLRLLSKELLDSYPTVQLTFITMILIKTSRSLASQPHIAANPWHTIALNVDRWGNIRIWYLSVYILGSERCLDFGIRGWVDGFTQTGGRGAAGCVTDCGF